MSFRLPRAPRTKDELWYLIRAMWGIELPRTKVCPDHVSPFDAVAHAYFAEPPNFAVWYASRGSGKSLALAVLGLTKTFVADADVTILGGSIWQSQNVREHMSKMLMYKHAPAYAVRKDTQTVIQTITGKQIKPLPASQTSVRGPHPPLQLLDEVDEMEEEIYDAAMGQAMEQLDSRGQVIGEYIVASSTWQNPIGTFTNVIERARKRGHPVFTWCLGAGSMVTVPGGEQAIETLRPGQMVLTRKGWRPVQHVTKMGTKRTIRVELENGRSLVLTRDHLVATMLGWAAAGTLRPGSLVYAPTRTTAPVPSIFADVDVRGIGHVVPAAAGRFANHGLPGELDVLAGGLGLAVADVDAGGVPADVVELDLTRQWPNQPQPDSPMGVGRASFQVTGYAVDPAHGVRPRDAAVGLDGELAVVDCTSLHVVKVTATPDQDVWDIGVDDAHEFVAEGIVVHNCWRELLAENGGWMGRAFIERKRATVTEEMWRTEYELNEPSGASRAFDLDAVERFFVPYDATVEEHHAAAENDDLWVWERPVPNGQYAAGADWAKEKDKTVLAVLRIDTEPRRLVALRRMNRTKYDVMSRAFERWVHEYSAVSLHDKTGVGNAVNDYLDDEAAQGFVMVGRKRSEMFTHYIADFEHGGYLLPRNIEPFYIAHRGTTIADVFAPYKWDQHTPDDVVAMALAHRAAGRSPAPGTVPTIDKSPDGRQVDAQFQVQPDTGSRMTGVVEIVDERYNDSLLDAMSVGNSRNDIGGWL